MINLNTLTEAELKVVTQVLRGASNQQVADVLGLKLKTIKYHLTNIYRKRGVSSDRQLMAQFVSPVCFVGPQTAETNLPMGLQND